jgi:energy-coupling factor transporter ATP-binding protein EcfA2
MPIRDLQFTNAGPFDDITFEFDEHVNAFVGPNNCGKSTALTVLGAIVVYPFALPKKLFRHADVKFITHFTRNDSEGKVFPGSFALKADPSSSDAWERWGEFLQEIGYTSFIPALRQSTDFRSEGPMVKTKKVSATGWVTTSGLVTTSTIGSVSSSFSSSLTEPEKLPEEFAKRRVLFQTHSSLIRDEAVIESIIELDYRAL